MNSIVYKSSNSRRIPRSQSNNPEGKDKLKNRKKEEKDYAQKFNSKQASCHPR
jgi:hypothetical protein